MVGVASAQAPHYESKTAMQNSRGSRIPVFDSQSPAAYSRAPKHKSKEESPSRLTRMQADYQEKMLKEKEAKMSRMYEDQKSAAMDRVAGKGMLREFFKERRQSTDKMPIHTHYQEKRAQFSGPSSAASSRVSSRGSSIQSAQSSAKGIDRSFPLEPIQPKPGRPPRGPGRPPPASRGRGRGEPENGHINGPPPPPRGRGRGRGRSPAGENLPQDPSEREMQELMKRIEKEKAELNRMRKEEEQAQEMEKKKAADQRRRQNEARKREAEAERRKQEAAKQRQQTEDAAARQRRREKQQLDFEEEQRRYREEMESVNQPAPKPPRRPMGRGPPPDDEPPRRAPPPRGPPQRTEPSPQRQPPMRQQRPPPNRSRAASPPLGKAGGRAQREATAAFYVQAIEESEDAVGGAMKLRPCPKCGRKFAEDRIRKHVDACTEGKKSKRKVFDATKMRTQGTEAETYARKNKNKSIEQIVGKEGLKNNWRAKHEEFQQMIKYNRQLKAAEQKGADAVAALAPPPPSNTSDYKQCPHCGRRFSPSAADRHIPKCAQIRSNKRR